MNIDNDITWDFFMTLERLGFCSLLFNSYSPSPYRTISPIHRRIPRAGYVYNVCSEITLGDSKKCVLRL